MANELVPVVRTIVGDREQVANVLRATHQAGRLVTEPWDIEPVLTRHGRYAVRVTVMEPPAARTMRERRADFDKRHPIMGPVLKALTFGVSVLTLIAVVLFGIGFLIVGAVGMHAIKEGALYALVVLVGVVLLWLFRSGGSGHSNHKGMGWHYTKCK